MTDSTHAHRTRSNHAPWRTTVNTPDPSREWQRGTDADVTSGNDILEALVPVVRSRGLSLDDAWAVVSAVAPVLRAEAAEKALADLAATGCCACCDVAKAERDDLLEQRDDLYESLAARTKDVNRMLAERDRVRAEVEKCQRLMREGLLTPEEAFHVIGNVVAGYTTARPGG